MKKVVLNQNQLEQIINLREKGYSWLKIENETGIARRIAKREYDEWVTKQSQKQLDDVRKDVAAQEFRTHMSLITRIAESLLDLLVIPDFPNDVKTADDVIQQLLKKNYYLDQPTLETITPNQPSEKRTIRMNELLFKSLQDHTRRRIDWQYLDKWKQARNKCVDDIEKMRKEISETLSNIIHLNSESKKIFDQVYEYTNARNIIEKGILTNLWLNCVMDKYSEVSAMEGASLTRKGTAWVAFHESSPSETGITFDRNDLENNKSLAKEVARISQWVINNLLKGDLTQAIKGDVKIMREMSSKFDEVLNQLVLRPIILSTRCDICPV